ncbi:MAG: ABC transporter permease/M1 family aminopeptidase [Planctomycetota bacterium]
MSLRRTFEVFRLDLAHSIKRPLFWILVLLLAVTAYFLTSGNVQLASGDSDVGGTKAHLTSEFALARILVLLVFLLYTFFVAVGAGLVVIRDEETKVGEVLHGTPLTTSEYVWGKFLAVLTAFTVVLAVQLGCHMLSQHVLADAETAEFIGPFELWNYARPAIVLCMPMIVFFAGTSFALGAITRRPILVFFAPTAFFLACIFFVWNWSPTWLDPRINRALMLVDPTGFRWLNETWLKVDRGVAFYNTQRVGLDVPFVISRWIVVAIGIGSVLFAERRLAASLRGRVVVSTKRKPAAATPVIASELERAEMRPIGFLREVHEIARVELRELRTSPGLYLFVPLIVLELIGVSMSRLGAFDTPALSTSGTLAAESMGIVTVLVCLLLFFYMVESLVRERARGLAAIYYATPVRTASLLFGKTIANSFVGVVVLIAAFLANVIVLAIQGQVGLQLSPFLLLWGGCLVPTFIVWCSFIALVFAISQNRYATYAVAIGALILTGYLQARGHMNWVGNWPLWGALSWSDMSPLVLWKKQLLLNRAFVLSLAVLFTVIAVRFYGRRDRDWISTLRGFAPVPLLKATLRLSPVIAVPLVLGIWLYTDVRAGFQSDAADKKAKDYWRKNLATWKDAPLPSTTDVEVDLEIDPARRWLSSKGTLTLRNDETEPLRQIPLTSGAHWENVSWTLDGEKIEPENRAGLYVVTPKEPLAPGASLKLGFAFDGYSPKGATENGGGAGEFVIDGGVVLTSFSPSFTPLLGFREGVGVDEDNRTDAKEYADDFYVGQTDSVFGMNQPFTTQMRVTAPADYTVNGVGELISSEEHDGKRTVLWKSDHPVTFFNVIAGRWAVKRGEGTAIYYHPEHDYNLDEMLRALDGARRYYSEWFYPYPWKELKISEFPDYAQYAQGFATNISFSEGIGFLTKSDKKSAVALLVVSHEAAHQWWGNILNPGQGPGGNILSEGMAHFSTALLLEELRGAQQRIEFLKGIEDRYGDTRQVDSERPLVKIDGSRPGDTTVTYDKGGWVFWMLLQHLGRERALEGCREFIRRYETNADHPVLQDFVAVMREFAPDVESYDAFVQHWFFEVVIPQYELAEVTKTKVDAPDGGAPSWDVVLTVKNVGTGRMPLEIAATRGERFPEDEDDDAAPARDERTDAEVLAASGAPSDSVPKDADEKEVEPYRESRTSVTLAAGESVSVTIRCTFEPALVLVDPDARVLQLQREQALFRF